MNNQSQIWPKHITVDKRIVKILSSSTYTNFPSAIRELITNSYDADADEVKVDVDLKKEIITISDNGKGMSEKDFDFYLRIAGKTRKKDETLTKGKRRIVGQFGVGFLSVLPFCEKYLIETKRRDSEEIVQATIASTEYFKNEQQPIDVDEIPIFGGTKYDSRQFDQQYTRIRLVGFSKLTKAFFRSEYKLKGKRSTITNYAPMKLLKWSLQEYLPIGYDGETKLGDTLNSLSKNSSSLKFDVYLNSEQLFRNIHAKNILEISDRDEKIGDIKFRFAVLTNYEPLDPTEARFIMQRNLNVGVGERTAFDLSLDGKVYGKLPHLTGEVVISEGLNDTISVSRDKFNFSSDYEQLKEFLRKKLIKWANELDKLAVYEKTVHDLTDSSKVTNIKNLKKEKISEDIDTLRSKGFSISSAKNTDKKNFDKSGKKIHIPVDISEYNKTIRILNKDYKLILDSWDLEDSLFPAIKFEKGKTLVNESYPLFQNKSTFDTFLKLHIIMLNYLEDGKLSKTLYKQFLSDISLTFEKHKQ